MADATKAPRRRRRRDTEQSDERDASTTQAEETSQQADDSDDGGNHTGTISSELRDAIREAAVEVLRPVATKATKAAAKTMVTQGPRLLKDKVGPMLDDAGGPADFAKDTLARAATSRAA